MLALAFAVKSQETHSVAASAPKTRIDLQYIYRTGFPHGTKSRKTESLGSMDLGAALAVGQLIVCVCLACSWQLQRCCRRRLSLEPEHRRKKPLAKISRTSLRSSDKSLSSCLCLATLCRRFSSVSKFYIFEGPGLGSNSKLQHEMCCF